MGEKRAFDHLTENHGRVSIEYQFQRADGTYATCCGRGIFLFEDDEPAKIIGTVTDITQQRNRERQLQDANNRYQTLVENIPNGTVCLFDEELRFSMAAGQGSPNISITPSNIEGKTVKEIASTEEYQEWEALYRSTLDGEHHSFDYVFDGQIHRTHLIPVETDVEGGRQGMLLIQDVTEHRKHEAELELKTERLERFAAILSHDLRNPLAVARGWNEMLHTDCDTEAPEHIEEALRRMEEIIAQMENLVQTGEIRDQEPVQLEDLVHQAWDVEKVETASLEVVTELGTVTCSPSLTRELLENLFRNAIDHSGNTVAIQVGPLKGDHGFYVEDDGPGIPAGERDIVFDAGYSTDATGTGFGLLIVKEIAAAHRWKISVSESTPTGARFEIRTGKNSQPM